MSSLPTVSVATNEKTAKKEDYVDPADYIFDNPKHHDCIFIVGRNSNEVEKIGGVKCYLQSQSSVFRKLITDDTAELPISDVNPEVFKLILRYVYRGKLPELDLPTTAQLALAADLYNICPIVTKACKLLLPKTPSDVFPALMCVASFVCPELESVVKKIIQEETEAVLNSDHFLDLDVKCLEYISKQERLSVSELDLWRALVLWAQQKATNDKSKTAGQHVQTVLPFLRLATFSPKEVISEVIPTNILTAEQVVEVMSAVTTSRPLELPGLYNGNDERLHIYKSHWHTDESEDETNECFTLDDKIYKPDFNRRIVLDCARLIYKTKLLCDEEEKYKTTSSLRIWVKNQDVRLDYFTIISRSLLESSNFYRFKCTVTVKGEIPVSENRTLLPIDLQGYRGKDIAIPLKLDNGDPLVLKANQIYNITLDFDSPHPAHRLICPEAFIDVTGITCLASFDNTTIEVQYSTAFHVQKIIHWVQ